MEVEYFTYHLQPPEEYNRISGLLHSEVLIHNKGNKNTSINKICFTYNDLLLPDYKYFVQEKYPINQSGFIQAFDRMRVDLEFYADLRMQFLQRQINTCNRNINW